MRQRHRYFLGGGEAIFAVKNHRVRAVKHDHGGAGALVFALVDVQVIVLKIERQADAFAGDGGLERSGGVKVERVAELVSLRRAVGLDARGPVACIVTAKA